MTNIEKFPKKPRLTPEEYALRMKNKHKLSPRQPKAVDALNLKEESEVCK